jgi:5-(carboxyamino)imidazole ribonucleotide synthase
VIKPHIGILGGGQLARMLALSAHPLGLRTKILTPNASDPAAQVVGSTLLGSLSDQADLRKFMGDLTALTFESEFVDIEKVAATLPKSVYVFPSLKSIEQIQDRLTQKRLLDRFKVPTSPWVPVETKKDLVSAYEKFENGFVLKQRRFGYDGYGTFVIKGEPNPLILQRSSYGFIAEKFVDFKRELAISLARSRKGEILTLPLVESVQVNSRCFSVCGPIRHKGLKGVLNGVTRMMNDLDYVGILAVEMFDTPSGLLVNELAPRVHNSAHYSQDALTCSQFEYHLRAGLDLPLPKVELKDGGFAMVNLLGDGKRQPKLSYAAGKGQLHWYGKTENRPGRKLGHINVLDQTPKKALEKALKWRKDFQL